MTKPGEESSRSVTNDNRLAHGTSTLNKIALLVDARISRFLIFH